MALFFFFLFQPYLVGPTFLSLLIPRCWKQKERWNDIVWPTTRQEAKRNRPKKKSNSGRIFLFSFILAVPYREDRVELSLAIWGGAKDLKRASATVLELLLTPFWWGRPRNVFRSHFFYRGRQKNLRFFCVMPLPLAVFRQDKEDFQCSPSSMGHMAFGNIYYIVAFNPRPARNPPFSAHTSPPSFCSATKKIISWSELEDV